MAIFNFSQSGQFGTTYFTLETIRNSNGFYDSSSLLNAKGYYSNFINVNESHLVTSSYIFAEVIPPGVSSFEFNPSDSAMPTGSFYFRGTGDMTVTVDTYSGSYVLTKDQLYGQGILDTFPLTPVPNFQARVSANNGSYEALSCQNAVLADIGTRILSSASLLVTPNGYTEGVLFSTLPNSSSGDFTVTRATTATRTNADGLIELVPYNLVTWSEQFENVAWTKNASSVTANSAISPSGIQNADTLTADGTLNFHTISQAGTAINGVTYTHSIYAKKGTNNFIQLAGTGVIYTAGNVFANFDLNNGVLGSVGAGATATITSVGDGWYRCTMTATATSTTTGNVIFPCLVSSATSARAEANTLTTSVFIWGAQLVEGTNALPYQPTLDRLDRVRLDYSIDGEPNILLEPQRTNLAVSSSFFDGAAWVKNNTTVTANTTISPSGIVDADTLVGDGVNSGHYAAQSISFTSGTTYTFSIYAKKNTNDFIQLLGSDTRFGSSQFANFDLNNGVVGSVGSGTTATITSAGNGWYRCAITITATSTGTGLYLLWLVSSSTSARAETNTLTTSIFLWGAQVEAGAYATSYIPTTTTSVTRNADSITRNNIYTNGLITSAGGTWFVELRNNIPRARDNSLTIFLGVDISNSLRIRNPSTGRLFIEKMIAGTNTPLFSTTTDTIKVALKWNGTTADVFVNGVKEVSATAFTFTALQELTVACGVPLFINQMSLYPTPLSDGELISLTTL